MMGLIFKKESASDVFHTGPMIGHLTGINGQSGVSIKTKLDPTIQPFLHDHQIDGTPVAYLSNWVRVDACPGTPAGCTVNANGCPSDSDGDTVCDAIDNCPSVPNTDQANGDFPSSAEFHGRIATIRNTDTTQLANITAAPITYQ